MKIWIDRIKRVIQIYMDYNLGVYAGNATLFIVTAAAPLMILVIAVVNLIPGYSPQDVTNVLFQLLPDLGSVRKLVEGLVVNLKEQSGGLLASVSAITTFWSASRGVSAIQTGLNQVDNAKEASIVISFLKQMLFTLLLIILIPALLIIEMMGDSLIKVILEAIRKLDADMLQRVEGSLTSVLQVSSLLVAVFALLVILLIYARLPATQNTLKSQLPGGLLCGVGWFLFTELFSFFIPRFYHASSLYGSLASLFLLLLWMRFILMILFIGEALNETLEEERAAEGDQSLCRSN